MPEQVLTPMTAPVIREGANYCYVSDSPEKCRNHVYRVLLPNMPFVPVRIQLVLVECLCGPDEGLIFCCTPWNFALRYRLQSEHKEFCECLD